MQSESQIDFGVSVCAFLWVQAIESKNWKGEWKRQEEIKYINISNRRFASVSEWHAKANMR